MGGPGQQLAGSIYRSPGDVAARPREAQYDAVFDRCATTKIGRAGGGQPSRYAFELSNQEASAVFTDLLDLLRTAAGSHPREEARMASAWWASIGPQSAAWCRGTSCRP